MNNRLLVLMLLLCQMALVEAGSLQATVTDLDHNPIKFAVVMATPNKLPQPKKTLKAVMIDQVDREFLGHVTAVAVGTPVNFPNKDNIRHHVYSFSPAKQFELPLYSGTPAKQVLFDKPGVVKLGCNIHDWMVAYVYVAETPYFATTDSDGKVLLPNLPTDNYTLSVWHPRMTISEVATQKKLAISQSYDSSVTWEMALKPDFRARRAPLSIQQGY